MSRGGPRRRAAAPGRWPAGPPAPPARVGRPARRSLGIFGGTFDPIHLGHLRCAEEAREQLGLDHILFIPAADPPHKPQRRITPATHRLAMVRLATAGNPRFRVSDIEIERRGPSYTVDTLRSLRLRLGPTARLVLLLGLDAFRDIGTWKDYRTLFTLADCAVWTRPPGARGRPRALLPVAARGDFCYADDQTTLIHRTGTRIQFLTVTALDISASNIRQRLRSGRSVRYLLPPAVERHVLREGLYRGRVVS
ncbi:nicotinate-nucleotide adenylyltransferase [bacterium]|nr:nicotinate-nucleotide adenylyltransferase [bacterium]